MPAHLRPYKPEVCWRYGCSRVATQELRRRDNESLGYYCNQHGAHALRVAQEDEEHDLLTEARR